MASSAGLPFTSAERVMAFSQALRLAHAFHAAQIEFRGRTTEEHRGNRQEQADGIQLTGPVSGQVLARGLSGLGKQQTERMENLRIQVRHLMPDVMQEVAQRPIVVAKLLLATRAAIGAVEQSSAMFTSRGCGFQPGGH